MWPLLQVPPPWRLGKRVCTNTAKDGIFEHTEQKTVLESRGSLVLFLVHQLHLKSSGEDQLLSTNCHGKLVMKKIVDMQLVDIRKGDVPFGDLVWCNIGHVFGCQSSIVSMITCLCAHGIMLLLPCNLVAVSLVPLHCLHGDPSFSSWYSITVSMSAHHCLYGSLSLSLWHHCLCGSPSLSPW